MTDEAWLDPAKGPSDKEVAFDYIKAGDFRTIWADGALGSATPSGLIHFVLYSERPAIPRRQVFALADDETLGEECLEKQISRGSIVREMACDVMVSPQTAAILGRWLLDQVKEFKVQIKEQRTAKDKSSNGRRK